MRKRTTVTPSRPVRAARLRTFAHRLFTRRHAAGAGGEVESRVTAELAIIADHRRGR